MRTVTGLPAMPRTRAENTAYCSSSPGRSSRFMYRNSERTRPSPMAPLAAAWASSTGSSRLASRVISTPSRVTAGSRRNRVRWRRSRTRSVAPRLVIADRLARRIEDHGAFGAVDHHRRRRPRMLDQGRHREHRRQPQGAGDDRGVAVGAAELGGKAGDPPRIHQRGIGRGQLVGEDDRALGHARIGDVGLFDQVADEPRADDPDILDPRRQIRVAHRGEAASRSRRFRSRPRARR